MMQWGVVILAIDSVKNGFNRI